MISVLAVFIGGGFGSVLRFALKGVVDGKSDLPFATFTVNTVGSFFMGVFWGLVIYKFKTIPEPLKLFFATGLLGGFTTFSALSYEVLEFIKKGNIDLCLAYVFLSILSGLFAVWLGFLVVKTIYSNPIAMF